MKRQELVKMENDYLFSRALSKARISADEKAKIVRDRQDHKWQLFLQRRTVAGGRVVIDGKQLKIGERYTDPLTGRIRFNTGR